MSSGKQNSRFSSWAPVGPLRTIQWALFLIMVSVTTAWGLHCYGGIARRVPLDEKKSRLAIDQVIAEIARRDPEAAAQIRAAAKAREGNQEGLAVALLFQRNVSKERGPLDLAGQWAEGSPLVELLDQAVDRQEFPDKESRESFLMAHGAVLAVAGDREILTDRAQARLAVRQHLQRIERARQSPDWPKLKYDAVSVWILDGVRDPQLRSYYLDNRDWLGEALAEFRVAGNTGEARGPGPGDWEELIKVARDYHPLTREVVTGSADGMTGPDQDRGGSEGLALFINHGEVIKACANSGLPVLETVAVLFANPEWKEKSNSEDRIRALVEIYRNRKAVWAAAMATPQVLVLDEKAPAYSNQLIDLYGQDDVASLILNVCQGFEEPAAHAIDRYGDIAIHSIKTYGEIVQFKEGMKIQGGWRAPMYMMLNGVRGIQTVNNKAAVDKKLDEKGQLQGGIGWDAIPVIGGPVNVWDNWKKGIPNEWDELGWAALDIADAGFMVATLGGSAFVAGGKQAAKATAKRVAIEGAEATAKTAAKGARELAKKELKGATALGFKAGMLAKLGRTGQFSVTVAEKLALASRITYRGAKFVIGGMTKVINGAFRAAKGAYAALPPVAKRAVYGALLVVSLSYSISERTLPAIKEMARDGIGAIGDAIFAPIKQFVGGIDKAIKDLEEETRIPLRGFFNLLLLAVLALATFLLFPGRAIFRRA